MDQYEHWKMILRLKVCKICNEEKDIDAFQSGVKTCKACASEQAKLQRSIAREFKVQIIKRLPPKIITNKVCKACQIDKPISNFTLTKYTSKITGQKSHHHLCRICLNTYTRNRKAQNKWGKTIIRNTQPIIDGDNSQAAITYIGQEAQPKGASVVYWIRKPEHRDIFTEGYVGIANRPVMERWNDHIAGRIKGAKKGRPISTAIIKEPKLIFEIISVHPTLQDVLDMERKLRPHPFIGWNTTAGATVLDPVIGGKAAQRAAFNKRKEVDPTYYLNKRRVLSAQKGWEQQQRRDRIKYYSEVFAPLLVPHVIKRKAQARNRSNVLGVNWHKPYSKWRSVIYIASKPISLGYFESLEEARQIRERAEHIYAHWKAGKVSDAYAIKAAKSLRIDAK